MYRASSVELNHGSNSYLQVENLKKAIKASTSDSVEGGFSGVSQFTQATKSPPGPVIKQKGYAIQHIELLVQSILQ